MRYFYALLFALLFLIARRAEGQVEGGDDHRYRWTTLNKVLFVGSIAVTAMDCSETLHIARHPEFNETNPLLGRHPSVDEVNTFCLIAMISNLAISATLPSKFRNYFLVGVSAVESFEVVKNYHIGLRFNLP